MATNPLSCATCPVRDRAACAALTESERAELGRIGHHRVLARGAALFTANGEAAHCATLISGALKISNFGRDGTERILSLVHPAGFIGEMFAPVADHEIIALTESRLCVFSKKDYERAVERFPALGRALLRRSAEDLLESRALIDLMSRRSSRNRVAGLLLSLARAASDSPCHPAARFDLPLTRGEMAGMLGLTIETVSRQLTRLEQDGVIRRRGPRGIELADAPRLQMLAG